MAPVMSNGCSDYFTKKVLKSPETDLEVIQSHMHLEEETNPFGSIKDATLTVIGTFVEGSWKFIGYYEEAFFFPIRRRSLDPGAADQPRSLYDFVTDKFHTRDTLTLGNSKEINDEMDPRLSDEVNYASFDTTWSPRHKGKLPSQRLRLVKVTRVGDDFYSRQGNGLKTVVLCLIMERAKPHSASRIVLSHAEPTNEINVNVQEPKKWRRVGWARLTSKPAENLAWESKREKMTWV